MKRVVKEARGDNVTVNLLQNLGLRRMFEKKREQVLWMFRFGRGWKRCNFQTRKTVRDGGGGGGGCGYCCCCYKTRK